MSRRFQQRMGGIFGAVGTGIATAATLLFAGIVIATVAIPMLTASTALTVKTSSMAPALPPGTLVVVRPADFDQIRPGAVVTYQLRSGEPTLVTHRVTQVQTLADGREVLITKGDNNPEPDADPIIQEQVRGTVWYAIPYIGWASSMLTDETRSLTTYMVITALLGYAAWMVISSLRERKTRSPAATAGAPHRLPTP